MRSIRAAGPSRGGAPPATGTSPSPTPPPAPPWPLPRQSRGSANDRRARLSPVEQLVLRGDGLTTTSLEILTGHEVSVRVRRHWRLRIPELDVASTPAFDGYAGFSADTLGAFVSVGVQELGLVAGDDLLIREVLLCGDTGVVYGTASVFAALDRLPPAVAHQLATTGAPIGKLLVRAGVQVRRDLRRWGLLRAGDFAAHLGFGVLVDTRVPGRTYEMRDMATDAAITQITEWFAPWVFEALGPQGAPDPSSLAARREPFAWH